MRILVAGGAGFVGSHLCEALLDRGHDVVCVDNLLTGRLDNIRSMRNHPRFLFHPADVAEMPQFNVDVVMHLASPASPVDYERLPLETMAANSIGTWRLLDVARACGARFVYTSTSETYGDPLVHPQPETYWGNVDPIGPRSCYDEGKRFGEALVTSYRRATGLQATIVRLFNTYGPRMRRDDGRVMPEMITAALAGAPLPLHGDGSQTRSFCFVDDLIAAMVLVAEDGGGDGQVLNIGNPEEVTIRQLAEAIVRLTGGRSAIHHVERRPGDPERRRPVIDRIRERYGWEPTTSLQMGLRQTIAWFAQTEAPAVPAHAAESAATSSDGRELADAAPRRIA
jgi:nucleoside-diphosphate-sugar epimerase